MQHANLAVLYTIYNQLQLQLSGMDERTAIMATDDQNLKMNKSEIYSKSEI